MSQTGENSSKPFDLEGLNQLYGAETVAELLEMSVNEARGLLTQIDESITVKESRNIMAAAHQLKGLASTMTINGMAETSLQLENAARQEDWDNIPDVQKRLKQQFDDLASYVSVVLSQ